MKPAGGLGEFHTTDRGRINLLSQQTGWRRDWTHIIPGHFGGKGLTDLLFYEASTGTAQFYTVDGIGGISLLSEHSGWRTTWNHIIPGSFGGDGRTDLLFYDASTGTGEFYITNGPGQIKLLNSHTNWRRSWTLIVPGNFGGSALTDLLFYEAATGTGEFYSTTALGGITELRRHANWRTTWSQIVPGNFGGSGFTDLLFYDAAAGTGEFNATDQGELTMLHQHTDWRSGWTKIVPGEFAGNTFTDLLFYEAETGTGEFYTTNDDEFRLLNRSTNWRNSWTHIVPGLFAPLRAIRVHLKLLCPSSDPIDVVVSAMREVYVKAGIRVIVGSIENLNLPHLLDIHVGSCAWDLIGDNITGDVNDLYGHRQGVANGDIVLYFVRSTYPSFGGCAQYPFDKAGAVITKLASRWVVAHEVGHILGLGHVEDRDRLMNSVDDFTNVPPDLDGDERDTMRDSKFIKTL